MRQIEVNLLAKMKKYLESEMPDIVDFFDGEKIIVNASDCVSVTLFSPHHSTTTRR